MVMLPIALAYGVITGLGPIAGMYCAIAAGFFAAVFSGTRAQISGPTGPMTLATGLILASYASSAGEFFTIVVLAGFLQIFFGLIRAGQLALYIPDSVISGFMSGIGIFVVLLQAAPFVGAPVVIGGIGKTLGALPATIEHANPQAITVAGITLLTGIFWPERLRKYLPGPLAALIAGSIPALFWLNDQPMVARVPISLPELQVPALSTVQGETAAAAALTLALVGSIDSLMNALMADRMTQTRHRPNRELAAQGIGNIAAGFVGGLPASANTAGTVVNIGSGGGRVAGALCALILLSLMLGLGRFVTNIPIAVLAGILVKAGWDIIPRRSLLCAVRRVRIRYLLLTILNAIFTAALAMSLGPFVATSLGMVLPALANWRQRQNQYELSLMAHAAVLTVFADLIAVGFVGLIFSLTPDSRQQAATNRSEQQRVAADTVTGSDDSAAAQSPESETSGESRL